MKKDNRLHLMNVKSIDVLSAHVNSNFDRYFFEDNYPKLPEASYLEYGEIAFNIAKGYEILAIKNYNNEVIFIPFNIATKLFNLYTDFEDFKVYSKNELRVFSGNVVSRFESIESFVANFSVTTNNRIEEIRQEFNIEVRDFSAITDSHFSVIEKQINNLSGATKINLDDINKHLNRHDEEISGITKQIEGISGSVITGINNRLNELSALTTSGFAQNYDEHEKIYEKISSVSGDLKSEIESEIHYLSASSISGISDISGLLYELSASTDERFSANTNDHDAIRTEIQTLSGNTDILINNVLNVLSATTSGICKYDEVIPLIQELSASTDERFSANTNDHDAIRAEIEAFSGEVSSKFSAITKVVSAVTSGSIVDLSGKLEELSAYTIDEVARLDDKNDVLSAHTDIEVERLDKRIDNLSAYTDGEIDRLEDDINALDNKLTSANTETSGLVREMNKSMGFTENGNYTPEEKNLSGFNVTEAVDFVENQVNEHISAYTAQIQDLLKIILEDETVTANFAATINSSCGFDIHAKYQPQTEILKGLNVTTAIDTMYRVVEKDIWNAINQAMSGITNYITHEEMSAIQISIHNEIVSGDTALNERIDGIEGLLMQLEAQTLEQTITYDRLVELYLTEQLRWGMLYRITNYQTTVGYDVTGVTTRKRVNKTDSNANAGFDILVRATSNKTLNENAWAMVNPNDESTADQYPQCWEIKYSLINDVNRFDWALDKGYGVIYHMKDNHGNEAPYDFKNLLFNGQYTFADSTGADASNTEAYYNNVIKPTYTKSMIEGTSRTIMRQTLNWNMFKCDSAIGNTTMPGCQNINISGTMVGNTISTSKNGMNISDKTNTYIGFNIE